MGIRRSAATTVPPKPVARLPKASRASTPTANDRLAATVPDGCVVMTRRTGADADTLMGAVAVELSPSEDASTS